MNQSVARRLIELAEEPGLWLPPTPTQRSVTDERYAVALHRPSAAVHRIRLREGEVASALEQIRALARTEQVTETVWWVGELSTPSGLADELTRLGLRPGDPPQLTTLGITERPLGEATAEVRRVESFAEYLQALEIDWEVFGVDRAEREARRAQANETWASIVADGSSSTYLISLEGEPAGFARAVFTPEAAILLGGATLPHARGRGVYGSGVLARWEEAVERGVPRIAVSAGAMSAPILSGLGFASLGSVRLLRDRL